jgi:hypothetical protein
MPNVETRAARTQATKRPEQPVRINPLLYRGWDSLLDAHPGSSFFHGTAWAAREERIEYYKYDFVRRTFVRQTDHSATYLSPLFRCMPLPALRFAGEMLYPHLS